MLAVEIFRLRRVACGASEGHECQPRESSQCMSRRARRARSTLSPNKAGSIIHKQIARAHVSQHAFRKRLRWCFRSSVDHLPHLRRGCSSGWDCARSSKGDDAYGSAPGERSSSSSRMVGYATSSGGGRGSPTGWLCNCDLATAGDGGVDD